MDVSIIIPVFDERSVIAEVLAQVRDAARPWRAQVLVVDDGSTDGTGEILEQLAAGGGFQLVRHPANMGKGTAIRTGLALARGEVVLVQDADLEYSPKDYGRLLAPFDDPAVQAVYGSRFLVRAWPSRMRVANWVANKIFVAVTNSLYGAAMTDEGTAYKAFRRELILSLGVESTRFEFCPEVTSKILKRGIRIEEVPVEYRARGREDGKKPGFADGLAVLWELVRNRFRA
ncbi:MAG: glycosyltransferase family 2 protein [Anaeromyxobacteraceae bacterium]